MTTYVAMGDSFTAGVDPSGPRWPDELARLLGGRYVNLAEVGATSEHVEREQLERALELAPDVVTLVCGANDVLLCTRPDADAYAERLSRMFARLRRERPGRDDHDGDLSGHLPLPRAAPALADARGAGDEAVQRRLPGGRPAPPRRAARGLRPPGHGGALDFAEDGFHPRPRATAQQPASSCARSARLLRAAPGVTTTIAAGLFEPAVPRDPTGDRFTTPERDDQERDILEFAALTGDPTRSTSIPSGPPAAASASRSRTACSCSRSPSACCRSTPSAWSRCAGWATPSSSNL